MGTTRATSMWPIIGLLLGASLVAGDPRTDDWRNIANGAPLVDRVGYYDQPGIVIEEDGTWVCVMTEGDTKEGGDDERVIVLRSKDQGKTWPERADIEPRNRYGPPSAWVVPVLAPKTKRLYAIYTYNEKNITTLPNSSEHVRNDMIGVQAFRYSQDGGATWSKRYTIPIDEKRIDETNEFHGKTRMGWTVGKPIVVNEKTVLVQYTKRGSIRTDRSLGYIKMENFLLASDNLLDEEDPAKIKWRTLPKASVGLRATEFGLAEEGDVVVLSNGDLYFAYRTFDGYINVAISRDGGATFSEPEYAIYAHQARPSVSPVGFLKNPNGPLTPRRMANGKYLILFYNNADNEFWLHRNESLASKWRNPYWISGGLELSGIGQPTISWSQPEVVLYDPKNIGHGIGYPDVFQDASGNYYVAETNKATGRVHRLPTSLVESLWTQETMKEVTTRGLYKSYAAQDKANFFDAPKFPSVQDHASMTLEFWIEHIDHSIPNNTPLSCTESCSNCNEDLKSIAVNVNSTGVWLRVDTTYFHSDALVFDIRSSRLFSHVAIVMDGAAGLMMFVNNGILSDGLQLRKRGWYFLDPLLNVPPVTSCILDYNAQIIMNFYNVALTISEIIGNFNAGPPPPSI